MIKVKGKISEELKEQILLKLFEPDCVVPDLSRSYGVSKSTLYKWRHKAKEEGTFSSQDLQKEFVELLVKETDNDLRELKLQKALLAFEDSSISIEGAVSSSKFIAILKVLEEPC